MAEEIDLHSNLCTTEEAFEEFQANSMYEEREDEYITLADIVPEQAPQPNFPDAVNYFSEQAVSSSFHNQDHDVNKQLELSEEQHRGNDLTHTYSDCNDDPILNNEKQASNSINSTKTNKRGRKKKNISNNHGVTLSNTNETQDLISVSVSATKKRGRKRKSALNISEKVCCNIDNSTNEKLKATESKGRRKNSKEKPSTLTTKAENLRNSRIKNTGKPRSRQRITTTENNVANDTVTCENILSHSCQPEEDDIDNMSLSKLKGIKVLTIVNEEEDVINRGNVTSLEMKPQPTDSSKIEHFESKIDSSVIEFNSEKDNETEKSGIADLLTSPSHHVTDLSLEDSFNCAEKSVHSGILEKVATAESLANNSVKGENYDKEGDRNVIENDGINNDEDIDDISLSKLKATLENESSEEKIMTGALNKEEQLNKGTNISTKRNSKMPVMSDFEYNIDKVVNETLQNEKQDKSISEDLPDESLLIEDTSKRPVRRKVHKTLLYNEESDEDPFANVELSDEEPRKRRGNRYYSDDEYIPGRKDERDDVSDLSDSSADEDLESIKKQKRKKYQKKSDNSQNKSPRKRTKKSDTCDEKDIWRFSPDVTTLTPDENKINDDIEICLETSVIRTSDDAFKKQPSQNWGTTNEFENFLAKKIQGTALKIKKVSSTEAFENVIAPLDIPVINPNEAKKSIEMCTQTANVPTESTAVQTTDPYVTTMKDNVKLTPEVSKHACEFLKSIVKTTAELGQLMTQKSEDFINKKINSDHITDTFKMDYCVKKSFLLFKLAKSNIVQMEEDLAKQYDEFLRSNNLLSCREEEKKVTPTSKTDGDSDCEIVEVSTQSTNIKKEEKPKFNPKTVFLNKELSIKIAKKTNQDDKKKEKLNIKGRHTIWINDSVMVKKVKPSQSFLAQDSRNKKPPDTYVTTQAVSEFFKNYFRQKALSICAPFVSPETLSVKEIYACNYFFKSDDILKHSTGNNTNISHLNNNHVKIQIELKSPRTLFSICTSVLQKHLYKSSNGICLQTVRNKPEKIESLFRLCVNVLCNYHKIDYYNDFKISSLGSSQSSQSVQYNGNEKLFNVSSLKTICFKNIVELFYAIKSHRHLPKELAHITKYSRNTECNNNKKIGSENQEIVLTNKVIYVPKTLLSICLETQHSILKYSRSNEFDNNNKKTGSENQEIVMTNKVIYVPKTLLSICLETQHSILEYSRSNECNNNKKTGSKNQEIVLTDKVIYVPKTLLSICLEIIHNEQKHATSVERNVSSNIYFPQSLKNIAYQNIIKIIYENLYSNNHNTEIIQEKSVITTQKAKTLADICYDFISKYFRDDNLCNINENRDAAPISLTINSVNTLSEEAYLTIGQSNNSHFEDETDFYNDDDDDDYDMGYNDFHYDNQTTTECSNWASQVQMKELRSCTTPLSPDISRNHIITNEKETTFENHTITAQIKIEPDEEPITVLDTVNIKVEPDPNLDEMTVIPDSVVTKMEKPDCSNAVKSSVTNDNALSFDENMFEHFVSRNKMMNEILMNEDGLPGEEIYSQSALRIRRQHQPDSDEDNDACESLLIPQGFEPLRAENAKDYLMGSSSNDEGRKKTEKKKPERRTKKSNKKGEANKQNSKQVLTSLQEKPSNAEVAELTKRMRDKIRHEERKEHSSDSETEHSINLRNMKDARKKKKDQQKSKTKKNGNDEIQCNNVDSTEQSILEHDENSFTGFSAVDQNEISSYQKYVKYVYDKIMPPESQNEESIAKKNVETESKKCEDKNDKDTPLINFDEPAEILECEPSMPIFDECSEDNSKVSDNKTSKLVTNMSMQKNEQDNSTVIDTLNFVDRYGWSCYPIDKNDMRLYQIAHIPLEKLPDSFVETYFKYQDVSDRKKEDQEVDRLTNLQTLHRTSLIREGKVNKNKELKSKTADDKQTESLKSSNTNSRANSPANYDNYDELTPSEDEAKVEDEIPPPMRPKQSENNLAKNSLMNDNDSDSDIPLTERMIKNEQEENDSITKKYKPGPKCSKQKEHSQVGSGELILTADKMMNKELTMLHAPVILTDSKKNEDTNENSNKGMLTRNKQKSLINKTHDIKHEDNSSSEEEKQWVNTKEKLLKRLEKRQENTSLDDAKRNKIVSDFIEKHGAEKHEIRKGRGRGRRSKKKLLERQKQIRVLSNELYGESSTHTGSRFSQSYFKGRRNIRKVIDKKSLARSTVVANMEEFERKRRLNQRQSKLRELLGCEEGVNVLVINDEVCLDYDFKEMQPIVAVHRFFTTVMKAHQYEGVKFMWDACFESLEMVESGHPGGGCILAHCMGLGKTLQVLALLHTVLTHPRVGMHRVLVCCPLSTVLNWVDEIHKWIGPVTNQIKVFELSKLKKTYERAYQLEDWYKGGGIFIIGYELFRSLTTLDPELDQVKQTTVNKIRTALLDPGPDIIVCDEGHLLKNDSSVLAVAMSRVVTKRRIVLTGTPMQNNLREYYCMVNFVKPNLLGTYSEYSNRFENPIMNGQHRDSREEDIKLMKARTHILHKVLEGCLQRQEASVLYPYLPKKHEYTVFISMTQCQWDLYKHYMNTYAKKSKQSVLKDFHILQKIWSHPQSLHNFQVKSRDENSIKIKAEKLEDDLAKEDLAASEDIKPLDTEVWWLQYLDSGKMLESLESSNKFVVLFRILDECVAIGDKVLIFSTSLITMDSLEYFLKNIKKWNLGTEYYRLDGSVPAEVRQKWCREFNAENNQKTKLFLISTRAGSLGLNMVAANRVIILDTSWNPAHDIQSIFRVYRFGQKKDCYIYRLVAMGTMEQKIYERSVTKQAVSCRVVDAQQIDRHYNMAELTELYRYDESGSCVAGGVAGGVRDAALLRVARLAALHAVHEHDSLLRGSTEQGLPEHERTAAWLQFQLEHDHKQNQMYGNMTVPVKRPHGHDYTKFVNEEDIIPKLEATSTPEAEPKAKRGRKNSTVNCNIPVNDQTTQDPVTYKLEEDKFIQKIINFLFKHNLHKTYNLKEINEMVSNLRMMCQNGQITVDDGELSHEIIIKVLRELKKKRSMPALTNVTNPGKKRARSRRQSTEYTPSTSCVVQQDNSENFQGRLKRKAALEAEKYMNTFKNDLSNNDGDIHKDSDTDTASENESLLVRMNEKKKKYNKKNTLEGTAISDNIPAKKPFVVKELVAAKEPEKLSSNDYILLLSDEDENNTEKPKSNPIEGSNQNTASYPIDNTDETRDEKIPLHPSLLKNQNFIKIVAHSYLSNNPFLDEDAAFLAAQYSTSKALKEVESIGNEICSGPIYDIAIKVLGRAILEKLHKSKLQPKGTLGASLNEQSNFARNENIKAYKANKTTTEKSSSNLLPTPTTSTVTSLTTTNKLNETTELTAQSSSKSSLSSTPSTSTETSQSTRHATNETIKLTEKSSSKSLLLSTPNKSTVKSRTTRHKSNEAMKLTEESSSKTSLSSTPITSTVTSHTTRHKSNETINLTEESSSKLSSIPSTSTVTPKTGRHRSHEAKNLIEESSSSLLLSTVTTSTITPLPTTNKSNETRRLAVKKSSELLFTSTPAISTVTSGTATPKVVPVGLIKRVVNIPPQNKSSQNVGDECILPDDDDIHLVNDATPTLAPPSVQHRPGPKSVVEKRKAIVLNKVIAQKGAPKFIEQNAFRIRRSSTQINSITNTPRVYRDSASKNQLASTQSAPLRVTAGNSEQPSIAKTINKKPVIDGNTICLDSDDDDIPINTKDLSLNDTSQTIPQVIPVTLTAVNPNAAMMMMNANSLETSTPQVLPIPSSLVSVPNRQPMIQVDGTQISTSTNILSDVDNTINTPISTSNSAPIAPPKILTRVSTVPHNITPIALPPQSQAAQVITSSPSQSIKLPLISTTSEKPPNKVGSAKIKTTRTICKPGDIIRINKDGNFEVLDKIDANFKFVNSTNNSECQQETSTTDKKTSNNDRPESKQNESNLPTEHVLNVYSSSGSSSDSSRPSSPDDPLAILKDVVKIVPADYNETKTAANTSNDNTFKSKTSSKPNVSTNKPSNNKPTIVGRSITDPSNVLRHKNTKEARNFSNPKFKNPKQNIKTQQNKSLRNVTGDNSKVVSLVDLTGSISAPKTSSKALDKPQIKATINLTDLTLNEDNAAVPKSTQRTNTQSQPKVIRVTCVDKLDPKPSTSASTSEVTKVLTIPAKKRRIDQMTLKDFDIDDIDDIIELE